MYKFRRVSFFTCCFKVNNTDVVIAAVSTNVFLLHQLLFLVIVFQSLFQYIFHSSKEIVTKIALLFNYFPVVNLKLYLTFEISTLVNLTLNSSSCEVWIPLYHRGALSPLSTLHYIPFSGIMQRLWHPPQYNTRDRLRSMAQRHSADTSTSARLRIQSPSKDQGFVDYSWLTSGPGRSTASPVFPCALWSDSCLRPFCISGIDNTESILNVHILHFSQFKFKTELE